jgi:hypothetical protein
MTTAHPTPRAALFSSTLFTILPSHYTSILTHWTKIAHLHFSAKNDDIPMERAGAINSLTAELTMLEHDITEYRNLVRTIDITDIAGIYVCAGRGKNLALNMAKQDLEDVFSSLGELEDKVREMRAELLYGFEEEEEGEKGGEERE